MQPPKAFLIYLRPLVLFEMNERVKTLLLFEFELLFDLLMF